MPNHKYTLAQQIHGASEVSSLLQHLPKKATTLNSRERAYLEGALSESINSLKFIQTYEREFREFIQDRSNSE